jgi:chromosomal replication initiator protein
MENSEGQQIWERALAQLKGSVDEETFATWLHPARFHRLADNTVTLSVPSSFYRNWLQSNYRDKIVEFFDNEVKQKGEAAVLFDMPRVSEDCGPGL